LAGVAPQTLLGAYDAHSDPSTWNKGYPTHTAPHSAFPLKCPLIIKASRMNLFNFTCCLVLVDRIVDDQRCKLVDLCMFGLLQSELFQKSKNIENFLLLSTKSFFNSWLSSVNVGNVLCCCRVCHHDNTATSPYPPGLLSPTCSSAEPLATSGTDFCEMSKEDWGNQLTYVCMYVSFRQGSSLLWTHTLRSLPASLCSPGKHFFCYPH